jgi:hypothetical protein
MRMLVAKVPSKLIANITRHRNLKMLARYDQVVILKVRVVY